MNSISIIIPERDYKVIERSIKKNEFPTTFPYLMNKPYSADGPPAVEVWLMHSYSMGYCLSWNIYDGMEKTATVQNKAMSLTVDGIVAHFEIDPTYEQG